MPVPALVLVLAFAACTPSPPSPAASSSPDSLLLGGETCRTGAECATGSCSLGMCAGYLMGSTELAREVMAPAVRAVASDPAVAAGLLALAGEVLADADNDRFVRARAADALSLLPAATAVPLLAPFLADPEEPVRFFAARALHRAGDARGTEALRGFLDHPSRAVRTMAAEAVQGGARGSHQGVTSR
ncbi:MAG: HEAT repeat domain-containing protein [Deltaproteobacteria bacterium]|nr:HEAT repeat domain-containing protein [Deltaproteobacteria bacterium]